MSNQSKPTTGTPCHVIGPSSRVCEHGTKSCEVQHAKPTTGEWTAERVAIAGGWLPGDHYNHAAFGRIAKAINAALAAGNQALAREPLLRSQLSRIADALAAEREKREKAEQAANHNADISDSIARASQQVEQQLREQLAAAQAAMKEALLPIAVWKLSDESEPYREVGPDLRNGFLKAYDLLMPALLGGTTALDAAIAAAWKHIAKVKEGK